MKKFLNLFFAIVMMFSIVFIGNAISSNGGLSVNAQSYSLKMQKKKKHKHNGIISRSYRGGKYVVRKTWNGTKWVYRRVWVATKWTGRKTLGISKKVVSRSKKIVY